MTGAIVPAREAIADRLYQRFLSLPPTTLHRCVDDLWAVCEHLGVRPTADLVERLAADRLTGIVLGAPPVPRHGHQGTPDSSTMPAGQAPVLTRSHDRD